MKTLIKTSKTFSEVENLSNINNYAVKCDTEKYATHISSDNVLFSLEYFCSRYSLTNPAPKIV